MVETWNKVPYHANLNSTVQIEQSFNFLGGMAANSTVALASLGIKCDLITHLGVNTFQLIDALVKKGISLEYCSKSSTPSSVVFAFFTDQGYHHYHLLASEPDKRNSKWKRVLDRHEPSIVLLTGGHYKHFRDIYQRILENKLGKTIIFSPSYALYSFTKSELEQIAGKSDIMILNRVETEWFCNEFGMSIDQIAQQGPDIFISTRDVDGCIIFMKNFESLTNVPTIPVKSVNPVGAGDAFNSGFIAGLVRGQDIETCAKLGNALASICVSEAEIQVKITLKELFGIYESYYGGIDDAFLTG